jgi:hypothetical protein
MPLVLKLQITRKQKNKNIKVLYIKNTSNYDKINKILRGSESPISHQLSCIVIITINGVFPYSVKIVTVKPLSKNETKFASQIIGLFLYCFSKVPEKVRYSR